MSKVHEINIGKMSLTEAEKYIEEIMKKFKNKLVYEGDKNAAKN